MHFLKFSCSCALIALGLAFIPISSKATCSCFIKPVPPRAAKIDISSAREQERVSPRLLNNSSRVVMVRIGNQTAITMEVDYQGALTEFGMIVPVPTKITREDVRVVEPALIDRLARTSAPRLLVYQDPDPCPNNSSTGESSPLSARGNSRSSRGPTANLKPELDKEEAVRVTASYSVAEYDIQNLEADDGAALFTWLGENDYILPEGARDVLDAYVKRNMQFFVAKVSLDRSSQTSDFQRLRPLQVRFESDKFMLPVRLGTINADGHQELQLFVLSEHGRVESSNYRTVEMESQLVLPNYIGRDFSGFYRAAFRHRAARENHSVLFTEYSHMYPLPYRSPTRAHAEKNSELFKLGIPFEFLQSKIKMHLTRLHAIYDSETFPEDVMLKETRDTRKFKIEYTIRNFTKSSRLSDCQFSAQYFRNYFEYEDESEHALADLTGWELAEIRQYRVSVPEWIANYRSNRGFFGRIWSGIRSVFSG